MLALITGGSGSGKSEFAENFTTELNNTSLTYIATMQPYDSECLKRIQRHREMRKYKNFITIEKFYNLSELKLNNETTVLLDCMSNLVANEMYNVHGSGENTITAVVTGVKSLMSQCKNVVIVTNEVFSDGISYDTDTEKYLQYLSKINTQIASMADMVVEVVYTIPLYLKGSTL